MSTEAEKARAQGVRMECLSIASRICPPTASTQDVIDSAAQMTDFILATAQQSQKDTERKAAA